MILYLDTSALVKRYVAERGTELVSQAVAAATIAGTSIICRAEMAAALAKAVRMQALTSDDATAALRVFRSEWLDLVRVQVSEPLIGHADALAWELGLRGYDAVHLASALVWRDAIGADVTFAAFDRRLWEAAGQRGLLQFPVDLPGLLESWQDRAVAATAAAAPTETQTKVRK